MTGAILFLGLYFAPFIVAACRNHRQAMAIFALNLLLGWTVLGWILALIWSLNYQERAPIDGRPVDTRKWSRRDREAYEARRGTIWMS